MKQDQPSILEAGHWLRAAGTTAAMALGLTLASGGAAMAVEGAASSPVSSGEVTPYIIGGANPGGNRTCAEVGAAFFDDPDYYQFSSDRVNYTSQFDGTFPSGLTVVTDGTNVSWSSNFGIGAVIVKGSNDANVYVYDPQRKNDAGLAPPPNSSGGSAGLSNITFCWNPEPEPAQWCSPGYWRQPQHLDSWAATGFSPSDFYNQHISPEIASNPTLGQVLASPQTYGGRAFNAVGDLLSDAHPDVNFTGERVEDSCPLN